MSSVTIAVISSVQSVGSEVSSPILQLLPLKTGIYAELLEPEAHWARSARTALGSCEEAEVRKGTVELVSTHVGLWQRRRGVIDGIRNLHGTSREGSEMLLGRQIEFSKNGSSWRASLVAQMVRRLPTRWETWVRSLGQEDPLEKEMATHSSKLAWKILWTEEPGRLQSTGSQRAGHDWVTKQEKKKKVFSEGKYGQKMNLEKAISEQHEWCIKGTGIWMQENQANTQVQYFTIWHFNSLSDTLLRN